jgi:CheY-like chemotaxis protein
VEAKKKIIIVEENDLYRTALKNLINSTHDLEVAAEAANGREALEILNLFSADLVILNLRQSDVTGYSVLQEIVSLARTKTMVLTQLEPEETIQRAMTAGANGYCLKDVSSAELLGVISRVLSGERYIPPARSGYRDEKRIGYRQECDCSIEWAYFNKMKFAAGRMINCGREGCYFETDQPVLPGSTVLIRIVPGSCGPKRRLPDCLRSNAVAEIKWCRQESQRYIVGAKYHYPV